jgi:hypothetical protein
MQAQRITTEFEYLSLCTQIAKLKEVLHNFTSTGVSWVDKAQKDALASVIESLEKQASQYVADYCPQTGLTLRDWNYA